MPLSLYYGVVYSVRELVGVYIRNWCCIVLKGITNTAWWVSLATVPLVQL